MARKTTILNKRELILDAASKLFSHYGFEKTTLDDIAKSAGIGKGTIYSEFNSKETIMFTVITQFMHIANQKLRESLEPPEGKIIDTLKKLLIQRILMHKHHAKKYFHGTEIYTFPLNNIKGRDEINLETEKIIAELLQAAALKNEIAPQDDYLKTASSIRKALIFLHPPQVLNIASDDETTEEANNLLKLILAGLTVKK